MLHERSSLLHYGLLNRNTCDDFQLFDIEPSRILQRE